MPEDQNTSRPVADNFARRFAPPELYDPKKRREWKLGRNDDDRGPYIIELNLQHVEGLPGAMGALELLLENLNTDEDRPPRPDYIAKTYARCLLNLREWQELLANDATEAEKLARRDWETERQAREVELQMRGASANAPRTTPEKLGGTPDLDAMRYRAIYKLWPDFPVQSQIYRSVATVKADAAFRSFAADGAGIVWAVIDSGIDARHPHFNGERGHTLLAPEVKDLHRCYTSSETEFAGIPIITPAPEDPDARPGPDDQPQMKDRATRLAERRALIEAHRELALTDDFGHGTHVAGIIAGKPRPDCEIRPLERVEQRNAKGELERGQFQQLQSIPAEQVRGMAPNCRLISLRVLDGNGDGRSSDVIRALDYVREKLNDNPKLLRVHGVNLSVGYEFDPEMFACGQSPICAEVNRLVQSGVVVVAAAGNTGFGTVAAAVRPTKVGLSNTINDPGNAELAITVGATHRDSPYTYGVSYFSSKGPTGDGRLKPDLVAPGERINSCGAGKRLRRAKESVVRAIENDANAAAPEGGGAVTPPQMSDDDNIGYYLEDSGTSMAAPHVSGAIAAFLSIRREFIGKPLDVKRIFLTTASPLGRERYFEGHGLIDLIRAIQSV